MIDNLNHFAIENMGTVYDEEALTALQLMGRIAQKLNEVINQSNALDEATRNWMSDATKQLADMVEGVVQGHIEDGAFDRQNRATVANIEKRLDNLLGTVTAGSTTMDAEIVDGRTDHHNTVHGSIGTNIRQNFRVMGSGVSGYVPDVIEFHDLEVGTYYSTADGGVFVSDDYMRSLYVKPCPAGEMFMCEQATGDGKIYLICYDHDMNYIGSVFAGKSYTDVPFSRMTLPGTAFVGVTASSAYADVTRFAFRRISMDGVTCIKYPFDGADKNYLYYPGYWVGGSNTWVAADTVCALVFPVKGIRQVICNMTNLYDAIFYDENCAFIQSTKDFEGWSVRYRAFNVPENAAYVVMNMLKKHYVEHDAERLSYMVSVIRDNPTNDLMGKKGLVVGDSITWLDGKTGYGVNPDQMAHGWQNYLVERGALVDTLAINGGSYATNSNTNGSLYTQIVTAGYDVSKYDFVVLFGGSNDARVKVPVGENGDTYETLNTDPATIDGAVGGIIKYILTQNPRCKIYLCSIMAAATASHEFLDDLEYMQTLERTAEAWHVPFIDLFSLLGMAPGVNSDTFTYDGVHPTAYGFERIGTVIRKYIEANIE